MLCRATCQRLKVLRGDSRVREKDPTPWTNQRPAVVQTSRECEEPERGLTFGEVLPEHVLPIGRVHAQGLAEASVAVTAQVAHQVVPTGHRNVAHLAVELAQLLCRREDSHPLHAATGSLALVGTEKAEPKTQSRIYWAGI